MNQVSMRELVYRVATELDNEHETAFEYIAKLKQFREELDKYILEVVREHTIPPLKRFADLWSK